MDLFLHPVSIISILIALSVHEWAHAYVATRLGDPTPSQEGRTTLNPIAHIDPLGALMFIAVGFGWGKPVPINPHYFHRPRRDTALTAIAGPFSNLVLAVISFFLLYGLSTQLGLSADDLMNSPASSSSVQKFFVELLTSSLIINLGLMAFNLIPIAPLDGSKVLQPFIPLRHEDTYEEFMRRGPYILLFLLIGERVLNMSIISGWVYWIMGLVLGFLSLLVGMN